MCDLSYLQASSLSIVRVYNSALWPSLPSQRRKGPEKKKKENRQTQTRGGGGSDGRRVFGVAPRGEQGVDQEQETESAAASLRATRRNVHDVKARGADAGLAVAYTVAVFFTEPLSASPSARTSLSSVACHTAQRETCHTLGGEAGHPPSPPGGSWRMDRGDEKMPAGRAGRAEPEWAPGRPGQADSFLGVPVLVRKKESKQTRETTMGGGHK